MRSRSDVQRILRRRGRRWWAAAWKWRQGPHAARYHAQLDPPPLLDPSRRVMVLWTPKVASSTVAIWFWSATGVRGSARELAADPHRYRQRVHYVTPAYSRALADDLRDYRVLKLVRDPYQRAVSSYRHAVRQGYHDEQLRRRLGRPVGEHDGFTFLEYLDLLQASDLRSANPHDRLQRHPVEVDVAPTDVVRLGQVDLFDALEGFGNSVGYPATGIRSDDWVDLVEGRRAPRSATGPAGPDDRLVRANAQGGGAWPTSSDLLTRETRERIARLYEVDLAAYFTD